MDKKNTMLLTVIAVATLLVAVVGATFAYFSVTGSNSSRSTATTATTTAVSSVALSGGVDAQIIDLSDPATMSSGQAGNDYFNVTSGTHTDPEDASSPLVKFNTSATAAKYNVATATLGTSEAADTNTYYCKYDLKLAVSDNGVGTLAERDGELVLTADERSVITGTGVTAADGVYTIPLSTLTSTAYTYEVHTTLVKATPTSAVDAHYVIHNTADKAATTPEAGDAVSGAQGFAGKVLGITTSTDNFICDTVKNWTD